MDLQRVLESVSEACKRAGRQSSEVEILPVSKGQTTQTILSALKTPEFPQRLGENYFQELSTKKLDLAILHPKLEWHYLGALQSRKLAELAPAVHTIHSVSRIKELERFVSLALESIPYIYVQFNVSGESSKGGFNPEEGLRVKEKIEELGLGKKLKGLMTLASPLENVGESLVRREFSLLRQLRDKFFPNKGLSMGMSSDFPIAIEEGATCIRLGTVLFGAR
jgi:pyridoxal phosphate enzyme (YggS family)